MDELLLKYLKEVGEFLYGIIYIVTEPDILKEVKLKLDLGAVKFEVLLSFHLISKLFQQYFQKEKRNGDLTH